MLNPIKTANQKITYKLPSFRFISMSRWRQWALSVLALSALAGCGGGGSSTSSVPSSPTAPSSPEVSLRPFNIIATANELQFYGDNQAGVGDTVGLTVVSPDFVKLIDVQWQQVTGPGVELIATHTPTIGFTVPEPGTYVFEVQAKPCQNEQNSSCSATALTGQVSLSTVATANSANIRLDHAAVEGGRVSLRVDPRDGLSITDVDWFIESTGPVSSIEQQDNRVFFDAPRVTRDEVLRLAANVSFSNGTNTIEYAYVGVRNAQINDSNGYFPAFSENIVTENMFSYKDNSPFASALMDCVYNNRIASSCRFSQLPLIGMQTTTPSIQDVMNRTLVSHRWMGERFEQYLTDSAVGPDMLNLLRGVTAVVISHEVRPSFYWVATGAIYLDADNFWQTPLERDTLNEAPDFRAGFGADLQFIMPWRYVKNNQYYPAGEYPINERRTRSFADLEADISWLMYHELGHANDFFSPTTWPTLSVNDSPLSVFNSTNTVDSDRLNNTLPLQSSQMKAFASVNFGGDDATQAQRDTTAADIVSLFSNDGATGFYNYYTTREDYASLFEKFMMKYRLDADSDVAITASRDIDPNLIVEWGMRNRFNAEAIKPRVNFVVSRIYPELDVNTIQDNLPLPLMMDTTLSWWDNIAIQGDENSRTSAAKGKVSLPRNLDLQLQRDLRQRHSHRQIIVPLAADTWHEASNQH